jgi:hypothetical protein
METNKASTAVTARTLGSRVGCLNFVECLGACETVTCLSRCYCADARCVYYLLLTGLRTSVRYSLYQILVSRTSCVPEKVGVNERGVNKKNGIPIINYGMSRG